MIVFSSKLVLYFSPGAWRAVSELVFVKDFREVARTLAASSPLTSIWSYQPKEEYYFTAAFADYPQKKCSDSLFCVRCAGILHDSSLGKLSNLSKASFTSSSHLLPFSRFLTGILHRLWYFYQHFCKLKSK